MTGIIFKNLNKKFTSAETPVLDNFSLAVNSGEMIALLGPSGIGKSTLLKLVAGINQPDSGDILFDGKSILPVAPNQREAVLMFQKPYLFPFLTVGENITFGLKVKRYSKQMQEAKMIEILELIGLSGMENRHPKELSGGEQQRIALARALVIRPKVLLLDEPFSNLDTQVRMNLQIAVRNIHRELGITTIFVTHDLNEAMVMSDRIALLLGGKVMALDTPNQLFQRPTCVSSAKFMGITTFIKGNREKGWINSKVGKLKIDNNLNEGSGIYTIRPENTRIQKAACANALLGRIQSRLYRGNYMEYQVLVRESIIRALVPYSEETFKQGDQVHVVLPEEHLFEVRG